MRRLSMLFVLLFPMMAYAAEPTGSMWGGPPTVPAPTVDVPVTVDVVAKPTMATVFKTIAERRKERKERRAMGLTVFNVARVMLDMKGAGEITPDTDPSDITLLVMPKLIEANPEAFVGIQFDFERWQKILDYLFELILFIIQIWALI